MYDFMFHNQYFNRWWRIKGRNVLHSMIFTSLFWLFIYIIIVSFLNYQLNAQFVYSSTVCMLHYEPQHVSSSTLLILRRANCITTAFGIVALCKQPYSMQYEVGNLKWSIVWSTVKIHQIMQCRTSKTGTAIQEHQNKIVQEQRSHLVLQNMPDKTPWNMLRIVM